MLKKLISSVAKIVGANWSSLFVLPPDGFLGFQEMSYGVYQKGDELIVVRIEDRIDGLDGVWLEEYQEMLAEEYERYVSRWQTTVGSLTWDIVQYYSPRARRECDGADFVVDENFFYAQVLVDDTLLRIDFHAPTATVSDGYTLLVESVLTWNWLK